LSLYNKLFTRILDGSIWLEDDATRIVWITLLAVMDENGFCPFASPANVAIRARVAPAVAIAALKKFESPDPLTPEAEHEGRRIKRVPGGYMVLNAVKHREQVTREEIRRQTRERVQRLRDKKRDGVRDGNGVTQNVTPNVTAERYMQDDQKTDIDALRKAQKSEVRKLAIALAKETAAKSKALRLTSGEVPASISNVGGLHSGPEPADTSADRPSLFPRAARQPLLSGSRLAPQFRLYR
jgi:hypothetical protein